MEQEVQEKDSIWYVLRVVSGKERKVKEYLDKDIVRNGWSEIIKQIFLPVEKVYKVVGGKNYARTELLPGLHHDGSCQW